MKTDKKYQIGTFIKSQSHQVVEVLGTSLLEFAVVDAEHAPFDRASLDIMMLAGKAANLPLFVRIPDYLPTTILSTLDIGAAGILVPHVDNAEQAKTVVHRARYKNGSRGFSPSPRYGHYGMLNMSEALAEGDSKSIICQIESEEALHAVTDIVTVPGVTGIFIGRSDLALSLGKHNIHDPIVEDATHKIIDAGVKANKVVGMFVNNKDEVNHFAELGVTWFVTGSDQSLLRQAVNGLFK